MENAAKTYPDIHGAIIYSDRGSQYTSQLYQDVIRKYGIRQ
ncbi:IS3 family transposase, partial [bacterium 1xD42-62]|nr:IS3 family transposase [Parablautia muri]